MSDIHKVFCNACGKSEKLKFNGEHWLPPEGWVKLWDDNLAQQIDVHMCPRCRNRVFNKNPED